MLYKVNQIEPHARIVAASSGLSGIVLQMSSGKIYYSDEQSMNFQAASKFHGDVRRIVIGKGYIAEAGNTVVLS